MSSLGRIGRKSSSASLGRAHMVDDDDLQRFVEMVGTNHHDDDPPLSPSASTNPDLVSSRRDSDAPSPAPAPSRGAGVAAAREGQEGGESDDEGVLKHTKEHVRRQAKVFRYALGYNLKHARKSPCLCCVGIGAVMFVVMGAAVASAVMANLRVVFFRRTELTEGENDFVFYPMSSLLFSGLNYTAVDELLLSELGDRYSYSSPRLTGEATVYSNADCPTSFLSSRFVRYGNTNASACSSPNCVPVSCGAAVQNPTVPLVAIDTAREERMGFGLDFEFDIGRGEAVLDSTTALQLGVVPGDVVWLTVGLGGSLSAYLASMHGPVFANPVVNSTDAAELLSAYFSLSVPMTLVGTPGNVDGKLNTDVSEFVLVDYRTFIDHAIQSAHPALDVIGRAGLWEGLSADHFASSIHLNIPPRRSDSYAELDYQSLQNLIVDFVSPAVEKIGFAQISVDIPLLSEMEILEYLTMFLGLLINIMITIFSVLSVILIYSLLMITMNQRSFEHGVMRMLGLDKFGIVTMVMTQTFLYSLPGMALGLAVGSLVFAFTIAPIFEQQSGISIPKTLPADAVVQGLVMALVIPLVSACVPIHHVLSQTLRNVLDLRRSKNEAVKFKIERTSTVTIPYWVIGTGLVAFMFGFMIYYLLPLSVVSEDLALLLGILLTIILAMLFGLVVLSINFEGTMQNIVVVVVLALWERLEVVRVVRRNLDAHRLNNRKTTLMFSISIAFVIFLTSTLQLQNTAAGYSTLADEGAYLTLASTGSKFSLAQSRALELLFTDSGVSQYVQDHAWVSMGAQDFLGDGVVDEQLTHLGRSFLEELALRAVTPNYLDVAVSSLLIKDGQRIAQGKDVTLSELLYTVAGSQSAWLASLLRRVLDFNLNSVGILNYHYDSSEYDNPAAPADLFDNREGSEYVAVSTASLAGNSSAQVYTQLGFRPLAFLTQAPGLTFTDRPSEDYYNTVVSIPTFQLYLRTVTNGDERFRDETTSVRNLPTNWCLVKLEDNLSDNEMDQLIANIRATLGTGGGWVFDWRDMQKSLDAFQTIVTTSGMFITAVAVCLSFFSLVSSMYANVRNQSKEIGILLALGMPKSRVVRAYVEEAFVLVFSSSMLGLLTGTVVAFTMTLQQAVMTGLPIPFYFPVEFVVLMFVLGWVCAFLAAWFPARHMVSHSIVTILHRMDW